MSKSRLIPVIYIKGEMGSFSRNEGFERKALELAASANDNGADCILAVDCSEGDRQHEAAIEVCREIVRTMETPLYMAGNIHRFEDIKKYLYTGAEKVFACRGEKEAYEQGKERFGEDKVIMNEAYLIPADSEVLSEADAASVRSMAETMPEGMIFVKANIDTDYYRIKEALKSAGIEIAGIELQIEWSELKKGADGLVPCIVQDYRTDEVLMMAYMNEEAYYETARTGKMCYYSRSRQSQWLKGETSGHYQYVKSLYADCDKDTLLAKVAQVGAACHTGAYSCFFNRVFEKENTNTANPHKVFEDVYNVIMDRKLHPKEGSYTNYLFDKGIDKILKKCGEEATEIVIAAKNPDPEEIKYEISDFLYHVMVLMAEKGVTWEDITRELANR